MGNWFPALRMRSRQSSMNWASGKTRSTPIEGQSDARRSASCAEGDKRASSTEALSGDDPEDSIAGATVGEGECDNQA
jgi:hypothetical protein